MSDYLSVERQNQRTFINFTLGQSSRGELFVSPPSSSYSPSSIEPLNVAGARDHRLLGCCGSSICQLSLMKHARSGNWITNRYQLQLSCSRVRCGQERDGGDSRMEVQTRQIKASFRGQIEVSLNI